MNVSLHPAGPWASVTPESDVITLCDGRRAASDKAERDAELIMRHLPLLEDISPVRVLELGGGYGRLAKCLMDACGNQITYTLVDAVPEVMEAAREYLADYPCTIVRAEEFVAECQPEGYDLCINIASMQEMAQEQVDFYIALFDRVTTTGGVVYLCNSRDYYGIRFTYPENWELVYKANCHRSLSPHYPVEVFIRKADIVHGRNDARELEYHTQLAVLYQRTWNEMLQAKRDLAASRKANDALRRELTELVPLCKRLCKRLSAKLPRRVQKVGARVVSRK